MKFIIDRIVNGNETVKDPLFTNPYSYGKIEVKENCDGCGSCIEKCVVKAIEKKGGKVQVNQNKCIYCKSCIHICTNKAIEMTTDFKMADIEKMGSDLKEKIYKNFKRSLVLRSVDTGSCNGCMLELSASQNTFYSLSRYGINFAASPRHADGIVVTGPVTINMKETLLKTYYAMAEPRLVIALGACGYDGGIFKESYGNFIELNKIIPVNLSVPGCPPSPQAIIYGLLKLMDRI